MCYKAFVDLCCDGMRPAFSCHSLIRMSTGPKDGWLGRDIRLPMKACALPFTSVWPLHNVCMRICRRALWPVNMSLFGRLDVVDVGPNPSHPKRATVLSHHPLCGAATLHSVRASKPRQGHWLHACALRVHDSFFFEKMLASCSRHSSVPSTQLLRRYLAVPKPYKSPPGAVVPCPRTLAPRRLCHLRPKPKISPSESVFCTCSSDAMGTSMTHAHHWRSFCRVWTPWKTSRATWVRWPILEPSFPRGVHLPFRSLQCPTRLLQTCVATECAVLLVATP